MAKSFSIDQPDWRPFNVAPRNERSAIPRPLPSVEGVADRLRAAAFAEFQARDAFLWAADTFIEAPTELRDAWRTLAQEEDKHLGWLLNRLAELGHSVDERPVSDLLWVSLLSCKTALEFSVFMATAEERGRRAGERFQSQLAASDPISGKIFGQIAREERGHIELALRFFPEAREAIAQKTL